MCDNAIIVCDDVRQPGKGKMLELGGKEGALCSKAYMGYSMTKLCVSTYGAWWSYTVQKS